MPRFGVHSQCFDPYKNYKFRLKWDGRYVAGVSKVSSLQRSTEVVKHRESEGPSSSRKSPSRAEYEGITLECGVTHDAEFARWANKVSNSESGLGARVSLKDIRQDLILEIFNETGQLAITYRLYRCWVSEWQALSALDADANAVVIQRLRLEHEGWERDHAVVEPNACLPAARGCMEGLAQRIEAVAGWDDLVLPEAHKRVLREIVAQVRQRHSDCEKWGFDLGSERELGVGVLFAGASGTGKTMAAEVLARELQLDLYCIGLANVVSKYFGETEQNLARVFDAAEGVGVILLLDEADALFGERSGVGDSHDRYANIEASYLLQRMESYRGLAILTTNTKEAIDPAFLRRFHFVVEFPIADATDRPTV